jgi:hypothetical protein
MAVTCTGADFNAFIKSLGEDVWFDDFYLEVNGQPNELDCETVPDDASIYLEGGELHDNPKEPFSFRDLEPALKDWLHSRDFITLVIEVPNGKVAAIKSLIEEEGVNILTKTVV